MDSRLNQPYWALRLAYGLVPIVAGLDKFFGLLTDWSEYLSPAFAAMLPFEPQTFMQLVGVVEIAAGTLVLVRRTTRFGAVVVGAWLLAISVNLLTTGRYFDIAARDVTLAIGAFALARLASIRHEAGAAAREPSRLERRRAPA